MQDRIHRHHAALVGFLRRRAPGRGEELAQEVWFRMARATPHCETDAQFRAYAFAVARRLLVDHHRRRAARIQLVSLEGGMDQTTDGHGNSPYSNVVASDVLRIVEASLSQMKPELAQVFRWRTTQDVSFKDIAARQQVSINTALGRMHQATKKIRTALHAAERIDTKGNS
jgi:RNA polymerase sigma-70 factor (ECF subfamily)